VKIVTGFHVIWPAYWYRWRVILVDRGGVSYQNWSGSLLAGAIGGPRA